MMAMAVDGDVRSESKPTPRLATTRNPRSMLCRLVRQVVAVFDRGEGGERIRQLGYDYRYVLRIEDGEPQLPGG